MEAYPAGKKRSKIVTPCFADDLILFIEASMEQVEVISSCLDLFCESSGEKVSQDKTRVFRQRMLTRD